MVKHTYSPNSLWVAYMLSISGYNGYGIEKKRQIAGGMLHDFFEAKHKLT